MHAPLCFVGDVSRAHVAAHRAGRLFEAPVDAPVLGRASVIDGDTLEIHGQRIRLAGIDALESSQQCRRRGTSYRCGQDGALWLDRLIGTQAVRCEPSGRDRYQRLLAVCYLGDLDLNGALVEAGHALAYRQYSRAYAAHEVRARAAGNGIWADDVVFTEPWEYRRLLRGR